MHAGKHSWSLSISLVYKWFIMFNKPLQNIPFCWWHQTMMSPANLFSTRPYLTSIRSRCVVLVEYQLEIETNVLCYLLPLMLLRMITIPSQSISSTDSLSPHVTDKKTLVYLYLSWSHHISGIISKAYKSLYSASVLTQRLNNLHWGTIVTVTISIITSAIGTDKRLTGY